MLEHDGPGSVAGGHPEGLGRAGETTINEGAAFVEHGKIGIRCTAVGADGDADAGIAKGRQRRQPARQGQRGAWANRDGKPVTVAGQTGHGKRVVR